MEVNYIYIIRDIVQENTGFIINTKSRNRDLVDAKKIFSLLSRKKTKSGFREIGEVLGLNHATVMHHCRTAENLLDYDPVFSKKYFRCLNDLPPEVNIAEYREMYRIHLNKARHYGKLIREHKKT